jgi:hypothetical protein
VFCLSTRNPIHNGSCVSCPFCPKNTLSAMSWTRPLDSKNWKSGYTCLLLCAFFTKMPKTVFYATMCLFCSFCTKTDDEECDEDERSEVESIFFRVVYEKFKIVIGFVFLK